MAKVSYVTEQGLEKLKKELEQLETIERPKISQQIAEARDKGDLSENAEYDGNAEAVPALIAECMEEHKMIHDGNGENIEQYERQSVYRARKKLRAG